MPKCLGPQAFGSDAPALAPRETPFSDRDVPLLRSGRPLLRSGTSVSSAPGRPASAPLPASDAPRGAPSRFGALPPRFGVPPRGSLPPQAAHLSTPASNLGVASFDGSPQPEGTSTITRKTGQKLAYLSNQGIQGVFLVHHGTSPQFLHCISPVHHCTYSGYI